MVSYANKWSKNNRTNVRIDFELTMCRTERCMRKPQWIRWFCIYNIRWSHWEGVHLPKMGVQLPKVGVRGIVTYQNCMIFVPRATLLCRLSEFSLSSGRASSISALALCTSSPLQYHRIFARNPQGASCTIYSATIRLTPGCPLLSNTLPLTIPSPDSSSLAGASPSCAPRPTSHGFCSLQQSAAF